MAENKPTTFKPGHERVGGTQHLTDGNLKFIDAFCECLNVRQAAIEAGYSETGAFSAGWRMMRDPRIAKIIRERREAQQERLNYDQDQAVLSLLNIYERAMQAEPVLEYNYETKTMEATGTYVFDGKSAARAMELICKIFGYVDAPNGLQSGAPGVTLNIYAPGLKQMALTHQLEGAVIKPDQTPRLTKEKVVEMVQALAGAKEAIVVGEKEDDKSS